MVSRAEWCMRSGRSSSWIWRRSRLRIYARDGFDCVYCRQVFPLQGSVGLSLDHVIPRLLPGGSNDATNLVTACLSCNSSRRELGLAPQQERRARRAIQRRVPLWEQVVLQYPPHFLR